MPLYSVATQANCLCDTGRNFVHSYGFCSEQGTNLLHFFAVDFYFLFPIWLLLRRISLSLCRYTAKNHAADIPVLVSSLFPTHTESSESSSTYELRDYRISYRIIFLILGIWKAVMNVNILSKTYLGRIP